MAWVVIIAVSLLTVAVHLMGSSSPGTNDDDPVGLTIMQIHAKYMVGLARSRFIPMDGTSVYQSAGFVLNAGTVGQRRRSATWPEVTRAAPTAMAMKPVDKPDRDI